jgi:hypothetical protein
MAVREEVCRDRQESREGKGKYREGRTQADTSRKGRGEHSHRHQGRGSKEGRRCREVRRPNQIEGKAAWERTKAGGARLSRGGE